MNKTIKYATNNIDKTVYYIDREKKDLYFIITQSGLPTDQIKEEVKQLFFDSFIRHNEKKPENISFEEISIKDMEDLVINIKSFLKD